MTLALSARPAGNPSAHSVAPTVEAIMLDLPVPAESDNLHGRSQRLERSHRDRSPGPVHRRRVIDRFMAHDAYPVRYEAA
jgi:hypothetical protein